MPRLLQRQCLSEGGADEQALAKQLKGVDLASRVLFLVLLGFLVLGGFEYFILIFLIPIIGWILWRDQDRISELERQLAALTKPPEPKPDA